MYFLTTRPIWLLCLFVLVLTALAMSGPFLVRRYVTLERLTTNNEVAGFKFATLGVLYAVLLAFAVIVVWERFHDAEHAVAAEAGAAATLYRLSLGMGQPGEAFRRRLDEYLEVEVVREWPEMKTGHGTQGGTDALTRLYQATLAYQPTDFRGQTFEYAVLQELGALTQARRDRLVLFTGAVLTITFTFFFGTVNVRNQSVMTGALALLIFSVLMVAVAIDRPFAGEVQISPEPLQQIYEHFKAG